MTDSVLQLSKATSLCQAPTKRSHWVIPNLLLASDYFGIRESTRHATVTRTVFDCGIQLFVNLMELEEMKHLVPYENEMKKYAEEANRYVEFISFPIPNDSINTDNQKVLAFCLSLCNRLKKGDVILIHCWAGRGRTGTIVSVVIGILFGLTAEAAIERNNELHLQRLRPGSMIRLLHPCQHAQVLTILNMYHEIEEKIKLNADQTPLTENYEAL